MQGIIFIISIIIIAIAFINWINNKDVEKSLNLTTNKTRGNPSELDLVRTLIKNGNEHVAYVNSVKDRIGSREGRIATNYYINPIPRSVRTTPRWLRNLR